MPTIHLHLLVVFPFFYVFRFPSTFGRNWNNTIIYLVQGRWMITEDKTNMYTPMVYVSENNVPYFGSIATRASPQSIGGGFGE